MAFISSAVAPVSAASLSQSKSCSLRGSVRFSSTPRRSAVTTTVVAPRVAPRMDAKYPDSTVLGLGQDVPSSLYIIASAVALPLGCYSIYMSNIINPLSAEAVNPQFIVGSLLVPISWGLHVAGFIQMKNDK